MFLAFWVTGSILGFYSLRVIAIIVGLSVVALGVSLRTLFRKANYVSRVHGTVVREHDAPALFRRLREIAAKTSAAPPENVVLGIDDNFFVTEVPLVASEEPASEGAPDGVRVEGRTLFASIPLMEVLLGERPMESTGFGRIS